MCVFVQKANLATRAKTNTRITGQHGKKDCDTFP